MKVFTKSVCISQFLPWLKLMIIFLYNLIYHIF